MRDELYVLPNGAITVVTVDDDGNIISPAQEPQANKPAEPKQRKPRRK